ncbi:DNA internalization-related competence protein ComEC/Rec2 [Spectribacter hydrogenoxidans]|uniref:DNA internalization-related competence protein ComEC/Rec2 n=1 Tax=Spectribacter hydrogenoxidans TaxID=3075608 RepID=A0ABU3C2V9_9GAMM|nr:DNA internalization-related competence protein ComEC/Rec2 [Salinisphaera sp. W335]MDT0635889.1 DNA internalization-related competence protein ComEC/Rec2 [Salinisphaera sp. W335]
MGAGGRQAGSARGLTGARDVRLLALAFLAGVLAVHQLATLPPLWLPAMLLLPGLVRWPGHAIWLAAVLGASWAIIDAEQRLSARLPVAAEGDTRTLTGRVASLPERDAIRTRFVLQSDADPARSRLAWYGEHPPLRSGDCWQFTAQLSVPQGSANPGSFDYEGWLWRQHLHATGYVEAGRRCDADAPWSVNRWRQAASEQLKAALDEGIGAALIRGLVLGDRSALTDVDWQVLRHTGTSHLMAISGLHIGLLATLVFLGLRRALPWLPAGMNPPVLTVAALGSGLAAFGYAAFAGFALPTQRALLMVAVVLVALVLRRPVLPSRVLALAGLAVLMRDPAAVLAPGFWLSFAAVAWILYLLRGRLGSGGWRRWLWWQPALVLALTPLTLFWFGQASIVAPLANAVLIPAFAVVVPAVLGTAGLALIWPDLGAPLLRLVEASLATGWRSLAWLAELPMAQVSLTAPPVWTLLIALVGLAWWLAPRGIPARWLGAIGLLPLMMVPLAPPPGAFNLAVLDVGQGLSAVVRTAGHTLLFDAGPRYRSGFDTGRALVLPYLKSQGIRRLDRVVISHGDIDHRGGWPAIRSAMPVGQAVGAATDRPCLAGQAWHWDGVEFRMLHPTTPGGQDNDGSCVLRISGAGGSVLLTGDIEAPAEQALLEREAEGLAADILVVPHHGSDSSSTTAFVQAAAPAFAVVPAGWRNRWGFPDPAVVARYQQVGAGVLHTGRVGAVRFDLRPGQPVNVSRWRIRYRRFWHRPVCGSAGRAGSGSLSCVQPEEGR